MTKGMAALSISDDEVVGGFDGLEGSSNNERGARGLTKDCYSTSLVVEIAVSAERGGGTALG